ncbi:hypothetical protein BUALT_Bualt01G0182700 [Buddleja alternifolia]|uniref:Uncharacterized protein n=1 Tax=Buddleja alternifolia TaxID=168488 RepID=A0AAV6YIK0_9LAMI|nr:hypothetical protein BUALT_Bualt01G0182700 [Buddleja alternifolia]
MTMRSMEDEKEGDLRVPLIASLFCLCVTAGGIILVLYAFFPSLSQPWFPIAALVLIGFPWLFWLFTYLYACMKLRAEADDRQISRRPTTRNASSAAMQQIDNGTPSSVASSKEPEMPLTSSV